MRIKSSTEHRPHHHRNPHRNCKQKTGILGYGFHEWSLRFLAGAQAGRGPVMSVRTFRLTRSGENPCRTSSNFTSSDEATYRKWGRIDAAKNVTHISVATHYKRREGETWKSNPQWHQLTVFGKLRDRLEKATVGDLVRITGRIGQSKYKVDGDTRYSVDLIADSFAVLAKAKIRTVKDDMED